MSEHWLDYGSYVVYSWEQDSGDGTDYRFAVRAACVCGAMFQAEGSTFTAANGLISRAFALHLTAVEADQHGPTDI